MILFSGGIKTTKQNTEARRNNLELKKSNFTFEGHNIERRRGIRILNHEELKNGDISLEYLSRLLNRRFTKNPTFRKVFQSIWYQVNSGQEIYVIGEILEDKTVQGGTGWGAEFAKICNKPLHVFDQKKNCWFRWNQTDWIECPQRQ